MSPSDHIAWTTLLWTIAGVIVAVGALLTLWGQLLWPMIEQRRARRLEERKERVAPYCTSVTTYFDLDYAYAKLHPERQAPTMGVRQKDGLFLAGDVMREAERRNYRR
jgi:hypothetical protein